MRRGPRHRARAAVGVNSARAQAARHSLHTGGLLVDYCRRTGIDVVVRGVRGVRDLDYEMPMARMNHELAGVETVFIPADPALAHVSSTLVTSLKQQAPAPNDEVGAFRQARAAEVQRVHQAGLGGHGRRPAPARLSCMNAKRKA